MKITEQSRYTIKLNKEEIDILNNAEDLLRKIHRELNFNKNFYATVSELWDVFYYDNHECLNFEAEEDED